ncbi:hypothetical protein VMCG_08252 [Cytospora schulzeri]|uniref:Peptidase A1 domain-containing protein n=1 Tax=Cytospora schulzeri TaxID=448051 RepID=A0A423VSS3_9PEZI|nr:hypothetical protein VMCG_08252 [Valsa malicola]
MAPLINTISLVAALAGSTLGSPFSPHVGTAASSKTNPEVSTAGKVSLKQVRNPNYRFIGPLSVKKTYLKYGKPIPDWLESAVATYASSSSDDKAADGGDRVGKRTNGSATTTPIDNLDDAYVTPIQIGTPGQTLNLDIDTGSADLWVFSSETPSDEVSGQDIYTPSKSSTSKLLSGAEWDITYGDGSSSSGNVYTDKVSIGGLSVSGQAIELAEEVSSSFTQDSTTDGLLGLAFSSLNTVSPTPQKTFFDNAKAQLDSPVFTADLGYHSPGTYNFGYIDDTAYKGSLTYTPVSTKQGFWEFTSTGYAVGSGSFTSTSIDGIADTGTTLLYLPSSVVKAYWAKVSGSKNSYSAGGYVFPCSTSSLPNFTFGVGSARIVIPGNYMNFGSISSGSSTCFGGIQSSSGLGINIFGDVALKAAFVVFDGSSTPRLGFASK